MLSGAKVLQAWHCEGEGVNIEAVKCRWERMLSQGHCMRELGNVSQTAFEVDRPLQDSLRAKSKMHTTTSVYAFVKNKTNKNTSSTMTAKMSIDRNSLTFSTTLGMRLGPG